jgi:hypothetical protein
MSAGRGGYIEGIPYWYKVATYFSVSSRREKTTSSFKSTPGGWSKKSVTSLQENNKLLIRQIPNSRGILVFIITS